MLRNLLAHVLSESLTFAFWRFGGLQTSVCGEFENQLLITRKSEELLPSARQKWRYRLTLAPEYGRILPIPSENATKTKQKSQTVGPDFFVLNRYCFQDYFAIMSFPVASAFSFSMR